MIQVTVKLFALARDLAGTDQLVLSVPAYSPADAVIDLLALKYPAFQQWRTHLRLAVNCEYVSLNHPLSDADEVAVIPPVSGG